MRQLEAALTALAILVAAAVADASPGAGAVGRQRRPSPSHGWVLVWADEFDVNGRPSPGDWTYERGFVRNEELQYYQPENAWCEGGLLVIEARRERRSNDGFDATSSDWRKRRESAAYTSASLTTRGLHAWKFGRFEMRARIDTRAGMWPAFWTLGVDGEWPRNGEVDIMEYYRGMLLANVAWGTAKPFVAEWDSVRKPIAALGGRAWSNAFHVWRMDWDEHSVRLFVDDRLLNVTDLRATFNRDADRRNPLRQPHFIILNLAIGGTNGGDPSKTVFPARFEVDYVRVYQRNPARSGSNR